jgi:inosine-uridine nucleoside N-ribohydrolase
MDDTWALCMLLGRPDVDLKLIVTAADNTPQKAALVAKMLERAGRTSIPIGIGVKNSDKATNQDKWLGDYSLDKYKGKIHSDGVQAMIDEIRKAPGTITLLVIGPQTNIQEALKRAPEIAGKARIVAMAGSVEIGYNGKKGRDPEYNVFRDVPAARAVFAAPWDITYAPLDSCGTLVLRDDKFAKVKNSQNPLARIVMENFEAWASHKSVPAGQSSVLYDTVAAYLAFDSSLCQMKSVKLVIDDKGATIPDEKGRPVNCALDWKDRGAYEDLLVNSITKK